MNAIFDARTALGVLVAAASNGNLDTVCERFGVRVMSAFGSATHASLHEPRDLDIGASFEGRRGPEPPTARLALWDALVELTGYENIDLVVLDVDDPVLRSEALNGVPLYERTRGEYAEAQIAAVGECRDTAWMRRRNLELMAS